MPQRKRAGKLPALLQLVEPKGLLALAVLPRPASAWNIPGHMLSAAIAYDVFQQESRQTIEKIEVVLEKHPGTQTSGGETSKCSRCRP